MEIWNKLFTPRRKNEINKVQKTPAPTPKKSSQNQSGGGAPPFHLQRDGIRVLLFRECDTRGRKLLYDSKTVVQVPISDSSSVVPSCKTLFKTSWSSGSSVSSVNSAAAPHVSQVINNTNSSINVKSTAPSSSSFKSDIFAEISGGYGYQYRQQENDTKLLGEMVFGAVALAYRGSCSKLHLLHNPHRILLSRTAPAPHSYLRPSGASSDQGIEDTSFSSSISSWSEATSRTDSLEAPWGPGGCGGGSTWAMEMPHMLSTSNSEGDSGFGGPPSPYSSTCGSFLSPPSIPNTPQGTPSSRQGSGSSLKHSGSFNSLQRRFLRNVNTSLEALGREGEIQEEGTASLSQPARRVTKLGFAVIIQLGNNLSELEREVEEWVFLHLSVIEALMNKLQSSLDVAYLNRQSFVSTTHQAVTQLQQDIIDLVSGPRLCRPVWLGLLGKPSTSDRQTLCSTFVDTLASVLTTFDTKQTNFFVSKLLTAVLTHHLGWVSTVAPGDHVVCTPTAAQASWVERLNESHPYNAIWAQLCELNGAVGYPPRAARTLLVGSNASLLARLLTILSYVIRCSQVVEQDIQSHHMGSNTSPEQQQQQQRPCFSRTSSVASIVTIVEGGRRDSQKDCVRDAQQPQTRQLQRESSIRRSWRTNRDGRNSRLLPTESRGDGTAEMTMRTASHTQAEEPQRGSACEPDPAAVGQQPHKKETDQSSKWMLNDDEEIVIRDVKYIESVSRNKNNKNQQSFENKGNDFLSPDEATLLTLSHDVGRTLTSSKTSTNLASLVSDNGSDSNLYFSNSSGSDSTIIKNVKVTPERLYPTLHELDDHRETFGPVILEPEIIAEKVHKLFRVSKCSGSQKKDQSVSQEADQLRTKVSLDKSQPVSSVNSLPRTKKSQALGYGFHCSDVGLNHSTEMDFVDNDQNGSSNSVKFYGTRTSEKISLDEVTVPATDIHPEIEVGGKVLYLLEERDVHDGVKDSMEMTPKVNLPVKCEAAFPHVSKNSNVATAIGFEGIVAAGKEKNYFGVSKVAGVCCLPSPLDTRKIVRTRNVGRDSARDLTKLEREMVIYPSLSDFKQDPKLGESNTITNMKVVTKTHRRHHSDPTNGVFASKVLYHQKAEPLKGVVEEQAADHKEPATVKKSLKPIDSERKHDIQKPLPEAVKGESCICSRQQSHSTCGSMCADSFDSSLKKDSTSEVLKEVNVACVTEQSTNIQMPRCACVTHNSAPGGSPSGSSSVMCLAGSLLGGVMDHYSSVFVVHATTQTLHWEDALRQDLSAAAQRSTLDQQVAEAVAVVADTDTWEVQVMSSHSYVVERSGSSGQVGLRVGMSPLVSAITDSLLDLTRLDVDPQFIMQHLEERLCELYLKSQLLAEYLLGGAGVSLAGSEAGLGPYHLPELTRALGLDLNDLPLLLAVASTHTPALTRMFGLTIR
ncbi:uncharacterized protein LOC121876739 [Homarus americanus]|uniref:uncharacterized protein LOC121876739 n=1 Tax=Homarus americanus TaxID=6706 RepID=UPI001C490E2B|nr:uncharacterized protein LOC121876739 [Homarus americanus]